MPRPLPPSSAQGKFLRSHQPVGLPTRGKTAPNRLRRTDVFLMLYDPGWVRSLRMPFVDLGFGAHPTTTLESFKRLRRINAEIPVLGVEIDPARVVSALPFAQPGLEFLLGGFNIPLHEGERAGVIRAMNVLRQYPEEEFEPSIRQMAGHLMEGGLLLEGTSDPTGRLMTMNIFRRRADFADFDGLVFSVRFQQPFAPRDMQSILPKNCIHHVEPGSAWDRFFQSWSLAWEQAILTRFADPLAVFIDAALRLRNQYGFPVDARPTLLRRGFLMLRRIPGTESNHPILL
jgi:hypothetical protein